MKEKSIFKLVDRKAYRRLVLCRNYQLGDMVILCMYAINFLYGSFFAWAYGGNEVVYEALLQWTKPWWDELVFRYVPAVSVMTEKFVEHGYGERVMFMQHVMSVMVLLGFSQIIILSAILFFNLNMGRWRLKKNIKRKFRKKGTKLSMVILMLVGICFILMILLSWLYWGPIRDIALVHRDSLTALHIYDWSAATTMLLFSAPCIYIVSLWWAWYYYFKLWWADFNKEYIQNIDVRKKNQDE